MTNQADQPTGDLPPAESCRRIEFDRADVISVMMEPPRPTLIVSGQKPWANMRVELRPMQYARTPEYWAIEVVGFMPATGQPAIVPYTVELDLAGVTGRRGIVVLGANKTERIQVYSADTTDQTLGRVQDAAFHIVHPRSAHEGPVRLTTVGAKDDAPPESGEIDLHPYEGSILRVQGTHEQGWIYSAQILEQASDSILAVLAQQVFPASTG